MKNRISMFLMNQKGYVILKKFLEEFDCQYISYVVTSEDKQVEKDYHEEIIELCKVNNIIVYNRQDKLSTPSKYSFAIGWRWIIEDVHNLIIFHDSLLPRYRGFAPLVNSLINKEPVIGVTALFASSEYDCGDIISQLAEPIEYPIKIQEAIDKVSVLYFRLVKDITEKIISGSYISSVSQDNKAASYSLWRDNNDYVINWNMDSSDIKRFIDSTGFPYKGASSMVDGKQVRILDAEEVEDVRVENRTPGKVIFFEESHPVVVCGKGLIKLTRIYDEMNQNEITKFKKFRIRFE